jgi:hypothetical protein
MTHDGVYGAFQVGLGFTFQGRRKKCAAVNGRPTREHHTLCYAADFILGQTRPAMSSLLEQLNDIICIIKFENLLSKI